MPISTINQNGLNAPLTLTSPTLSGTTTATTITSPAATALTLQSAGTTAVTVNTSQNVGIGTSSPLAKLDVVSSSGTYRNRMRNSSVGESFLLFQNSASGTNDNNGLLTGIGSDGVAYLYNYQNTALLFATNGSERMRIEANGDLIVGTSSKVFLEKQNLTYSGSTNYGFAINETTASGTAQQIVFYKNGSAVGSVTSTTGGTAFNTSSDYRLKENIAPMVGALATIQALKPVTFNWKIDGSNGQGFIAHELQAVVPDCVSGEKDGEQMQGVDTSFLVATLTAAIQELKAEFDAYKASHP